MAQIPKLDLEKNCFLTENAVLVRPPDIATPKEPRRSRTLCK